MTPLAVPRDQAAELVLAGSAIGHPVAAAAVAASVDPGDFYDTRLRAVVETAATLDDLPQRVPTIEYEEAAELWPMVPPSSIGLRIGVLSVLVGEDVEYLRDVASQRLIVTGSPSPWAERVADAAARRRVMGAALNLYNRLAAGRPLESVADLIVEIGEHGRTAGVDAQWEQAA